MLDVKMRYVIIDGLIGIGGEVEGLSEVLIFVASGKVDVVDVDVGSVIEYHDGCVYDGLELSAHALAIDGEVIDVGLERLGVHESVMLLTHLEGMIAAEVACCLLVGELVALCEFGYDGYDVL